MSTPSSPSKALISLIPVGGSQNNEWRPIYQRSNAVVLYNSTSHALTIRHDVQPPSQPSLCPYCNQELPPGFVSDHDDMRDTLAPNYFHLLSVANEATSRPSSPVIDEKGRGFPTGVMAEGYFNTFFREEGRLGIGANGSVYLCQHVLNGNELGHFAVKKVAVGDSPEYLVNILSEVRLLETLQHPNIITYHHAWLESCRFSSFGPSIPTLHILMQWAEGGSLDDLIETRSGMKASHSVGGDESSGDLRTRSERIRAFRAKQHISAEERKRLRERNRDCTTAVHLFSAAEIKSLMSDIVSGLAFLHDKSILHLDLKPLNVLLTYDEGRLIPRAMLCDFGTSRDMLRSSSMRSGNTGTLEYCSPESIMQKSPRVFQPIDSKSDMWSLGMVLHKMLFFRLPFAHVQDSDIDGLEREILTYPGFKPSPEISGTIRRRMLPRAVIVLLESLLHVSPKARPTCEQVLAAIKDGKLDPLVRESTPGSEVVSLVTRRPSQSPPTSPLLDAPPDLPHNPRTTDHKHEVPLLQDDEEPNPPLPLPAPSLGVLSLLNTRQPEIIHYAKVILLIIKVLSLNFLCQNAPPRIGVQFIILVLAAVDTCFSDLWTLLLFGFMHLFIISFHHRCCQAPV